MALFDEKEQIEVVDSKFNEVPVLYLGQHESTEYYEGLKKSTVVKEVVIVTKSQEQTQWDLILDALRVNQSIVKSWITITHRVDIALKAVAEYLSFSKVKKFRLYVTPYDQDERDQEANYEAIATSIKLNRYIERITIGSQMHSFIVNLKPIFESVKAHPTIKRLTVSTFGLKLVDMPIMDEMIRNSALTTLCLAPEETDDENPTEYAKQLVNILGANKNLTSFKIKDYQFHNPNTLGLLLENIILSKCSLEVLDLPHMYDNATPDFGEKIEKFLAANGPLKSFGLHVSQHFLFDRNCIGNGLARNTNLKVLDLQMCDGLEDVVLSVLKTNRSITSVDFRGNTPSEQTIELVTEVLKNNNVLRALKFETMPNASQNQIWNALKVNQTLTDLHIMRFPQNLPDLTAFKEMLQVNRSITKLHLDNSSGFEPQKGAFLDLIHSFTERNKLEQRLNVTYTLQTIAMISKSSSFREKCPRELWRHIYSFVVYPGIVMDFASLIPS